MAEDSCNIVVEKTFTDVQGFIRALVPIYEDGFYQKTYSSPPGRMIFRGHKNDVFDLVPSALRRDKDSPLVRFGHSVPATNSSQIQVERDLIWKFFEQADMQGLPLPEDSQALRNLLFTLFDRLYLEDVNRGKASWPPRELWSLIGIAQHYGVPTRILDWTYEPLTAAYFAVEGALKDISNMAIEVSVSNPKLDFNQRFLSVWAFSIDRLISFSRDSLFTAYGSYNNNNFVRMIPEHCPVVRITAPHSGNANLHAQNGLFTMVKTDFSGMLQDTPGDGNLVETLETFVNRKAKKNSSIEFLFRYRLPWQKARQAMVILHDLGVNRAKLFPGYDGVADSLIERVLARTSRFSLD